MMCKFANYLGAILDNMHENLWFAQELTVK